MIADWLGQPSLALGFTERIAAVGAVLASLELLARPAVLRADGLLSWPVARLRSARLSAGPAAAVLDPLLATPGVYALGAVRAAGGTVVVLAPSGSVPSVAALTVTALSSLLLMTRTSYGNDGADQMLLLVLVPSALARLVGSDRALTYALWFIAVQCCLAYVTSGLGKVAGRSWRDGTGLVGVLTTRTYGRPTLARLLRQRLGLARLLSWWVIAVEVAFPLVLVAPRPVVVLLLAAGLTFHVTTAVVMGLNSFVWAFLAAYPALVYLVW